jgi:type I restriction enzyme S subunit
MKLNSCQWRWLMNDHNGYRDSGFEWIGEIPNDWKLSRVGKYFTERTEKADDVTYPPLSVTMSGIVDQLSNVAKTNDGENRKLIKKDDFVINSRSDRKGSSGIAPRDGSVSLINIALEPHDIDPQFIQHLFKSYYFKEEFFRNGKGIHWDLWTTRWDQFKNIVIPVPLHKEQNLISRYLDKKTRQIDSMIKKIEKKIDLLKEQRISMINQYVTKGLDPNVQTKDSGVEWVADIPKHWNIYPIKHIFLEYFGGSWGEDPIENQTENLVQVIRVTEFDMEELTVTKRIPTIRSLNLSTDSKKLVIKNDLILEKSGGGEKTPVGRIVLVDRKIDFPTINSNFTNICRPNPKIINPKFALFSLFAGYINGRTLRNIKQTTGIQNLDLDGFMAELIPLPPLQEQSEIASILEVENKQFLKRLKQLLRYIDLLKEYRQSIISSAVTGKVRVTEEMV